MKKRTFIIVGILLVLASALGFMVWKIIGKVNQKKQIEVYTQHLPVVGYWSVTGQKKVIKPQGATPVVLLFFNTECDHCQAEAKLIRKEHKRLENSTLYFLSIEPLEKIKAFAEAYQLTNLPNVHIGQVDATDATEKFGIRSFPHVFIYSEKGILQKQYKGEVKIEALLDNFH